MAGEVGNPVQQRLLEALGRYRLLNPQQMVRVGVHHREDACRSEGDALARKHLLHHSGEPDGPAKTKPPPLVSGVTCLPRLYWLSHRGAALLPLENGWQPLGSRRDMGDYDHIIHRMKTVDLHIALRVWAAAEPGREVYRYVTDFEPGSGGREKPTTITYKGGEFKRYVPDALATVIGPDGQPRALAIEIERNRRQGTRLTEFPVKVRQMREARLLNVVEGRFNRPKLRARFLVIFARADTREKAVARWPEPDADEWRNFFIKSEDELGDFNADWWRPGGASRRPLFSFAPSAQPTTTMPLPGL